MPSITRFDDPLTKHEDTREMVMRISGIRHLRFDAMCSIKTNDAQIMPAVVIAAYESPTVMIVTGCVVTTRAVVATKRYKANVHT